MAKISFLSNIASLQAQRRLTENTKELGKSNERLSSGLRVNRASDDAAGIAIAASLNVDGRVFGQAIRNLNDGISLLNIAEGSVSEARNIVFRLRELGEQSANGVLTSVQRQSIDGEGQALISEYNRIISVTEFNGLKLLDGSLTNLTLQAGYGTAGELTVSIGQQLPRYLGSTTTPTAADGTFQARTSYSTGIEAFNFPLYVVVGDVNSDAKLDIVSSNGLSTALGVFLGNGNGSFQAVTSYTSGISSLTLGDLDGDAKLDIVGVSQSANRAVVYLGNGNGSFQAYQLYTTGSQPRSAAIGDVNGDGKLDIVSGDYATGASRVSVLLGNGNGTFKARTSYTVGTNPISATLNDLNGDGKLDIITADLGVDKLSVRLGNGNGSFQARTSYSTGSNPKSLTVGDIDGDGKLDIVTADSSAAKASVFFGNGNGSFQARISYSIGTSPQSIALGDLNGDAKLDIVSADFTPDTVSVLLNNSNGTFKAKTSYPTGADPISLALGDTNGDAFLDIVAINNSDKKVNVFLPNITTTTTGTPISFLTQASSLAALTTLASVQTSIENELANIGSIQSRLGTALTNLQQTRENYNAAESRIVDVDVAEESANLVKHQILQNASSAILAQANQEPALLLLLLKP